MIIIGENSPKLQIDVDQTIVDTSKYTKLINLTGVTLVGDVLFIRGIYLQLFLTNVNINGIDESTATNRSKILLEYCMDCTVEIINCVFVNSLIKFRMYSNTKLSFISTQFFSNTSEATGLQLSYPERYGKNIVYMNMCHFSGHQFVEEITNPSGSFSLKMEKSTSEVKVVIENTVFLANTRAIDLSLKGRSGINISNCSFVSNKATGSGAGVRIIETRESGLGIMTIVRETKIIIKDSHFQNNYAQTASYYDKNDVYHQTRSPGSGGAIFVFLTAKSPIHHDGLIQIKNCYFKNNTADLQGGTIFVNSGISVYIANSTINGSALAMGAQAGHLVHATNNMTICNTTMTSMTSNDLPFLFYKAMDPHSARLIIYDISLVCLTGHEIKSVNTSSLAKNGGLESLQISCKACSEGQYSLSQSRAHLSGTTANITYEMSCRTCPYGGKCHKGIWNNNGFWGSETESGEVVMNVCPEDYCEMNDTDLISYDSCAAHRTGTLCGRCEEGYSESMFGAVCVPNSECGSHNWHVGFLIGIYGIFYVLFFMFERDWGRFFTYLLGKIRREDNADSDDDIVESGYFQIFMYFIQTSVLLKVSIVMEKDEIYQSVHRPQDMLPAPLMDGIKDILTFDVLAFHSKTCLFSDLNPAKKIAIKALFVTYLFVLLMVFHIFSVCCCLCLAQQRRQAMHARVTATVVALFLYTYQIVAEDAFLLLNCTHIDGKYVLFYDGNIHCLQKWQYAVMALVIVFVIPFFITLLFVPKLLQRNRIGLRFFFLSVTFPLFFAVPTIVMFFCHYKFKNPAKIYQDQSLESEHNGTMCCGGKTRNKSKRHFITYIKYTITEICFILYSAGVDTLYMINIRT